MSNITKLDTYDYTVLPSSIRIRINGTNDPDLVDILSEIRQTEGRIYVEGSHYRYLDNYRLDPTYLELDVEKTA